MIALLDAHDASRRELHLMIKGMGYDVRAHSNADALARDQLAARATWLIINGGHDGETLALLRALRKSGWLGRAAVIVDAPTPAALSGAIRDPGVSVLTHPATPHSLGQLLSCGSPMPTRHCAP